MFIASSQGGVRKLKEMGGGDKKLQECQDWMN